MTTEQKKEIKTAINTFKDVKGLSQKEAANLIGISDATLIQIEKNNWDSISNRMWLKIKNAVTSPAAAQLVVTKDYQAVTSSCNHARKNRLMIGLTGDTGMGKTTALTSYANQRNVFYIKFDKTFNPKQFFISLLRVMGVQFEGSIHALLEKAASELNTVSSPLLIIDEAGKMPHTMMLYLHELRDKTMLNAGIILGGMPYFKTNLLKYANKQKEGVAEFYRRVNMWHSLNGLSRSEIKAICQLNGINDDEDISEMYEYKRFGDLVNQIMLKQLVLVY